MQGVSATQSRRRASQKHGPIANGAELQGKSTVLAMPPRRPRPPFL